MFTGAKVPKDCYEPVFDEIDAAMQLGLHRKMRGIPVYKIPCKDGSVYYVAGEPKGRDRITVYGWVNVLKPRMWECWVVIQSFVFPQARGGGWGKLLYDTIITRDGLILASGNTQSVSGRRMWKSMIRSDRYTIWAHDFKNTARFADVVYDEDRRRIFSPLKIYEPRTSFVDVKADVRLMAIKKTKTRARK